MLRATQSSEIPAAELARAKADDTQRTRMLKDVMKSVSKYASGGLGKEKNESAAAAAQLTLKAAEEEEEMVRKAVQAKERDPCEWGFLSADQEGRLKSTVASDDHVMELAVGEEFCELLKYSGNLVNDLSNSLSSSRPLPERPPHIDSSPADGIYLVPRHEAEDIVAGGATDHKRREQAAWSWVQDHVKFKELDKLSRHIDDTKSYQDVRKHFESHHKYHPVLTELSDHSLIDGNLWQRAVFEAMFPKEVEEKAQKATKAQPSFFAPKALSRTAKGLGNSRPSLSPGSPKAVNKISWASPAAGGPAAAGLGNRSRAATMPGGGLGRDRSAPTLR